MSNRSDIIEGAQAPYANRGLVYTEVLGWVDLGHAQGTDIRELLRLITLGEFSGKHYYEVRYSQGMSGIRGQFRSGKMTTWQIRHGRPGWEQKSIALAMMMSIARKFEDFQSAFPYHLGSDSGFSGEDLVSDLLGFYRVVSIQNPFEMLRPVSKNEALKRWDYYGNIGRWKNETFRPLLFPDPEKFPHSSPRRGVLPAFMRTVIPYHDFLSGNVILPRHDKTFMILGSVESRMGL